MTQNQYTSTEEQYGDLVSAYGGGQGAYYAFDAVGSTDALLDDTGSVTDRYANRAFGLFAHTQGTSPNDRTFVGRQGYEWDLETSLYFLRARYEDPDAGRFLSPDPAHADINRYRYCGNDPVSKTDPSGLKADDDQGDLGVLQATIVTGVPVKHVKDISGPDVTDWYAREIADQILYRVDQQRKAYQGVLANVAGPDRVMADEGSGLVVGEMANAETNNLLSFFHQAKYYMAPKWMDFGSPSEGKGVNTVVVAGRVLRKNQLGNIEFGVIVNLLPPPGFSAKGVKYQSGVKEAYEGFARNNDEGHTYVKNDPHSVNYGVYKGLNRADNLAAFGVGYGIQEDIDKLPIMKKLRASISDKTLVFCLSRIWKNSPVGLA